MSWQDKPAGPDRSSEFPDLFRETSDGSKIRNLWGRSMRLSRLFETTGVPAEQEQEMLRRLEHQGAGDGE